MKNILKQQWFYDGTYLKDKVTPEVTLLTRQITLYKLPSGRTVTALFRDAEAFNNDQVMAESIKSRDMQELPLEAEGKPFYVPHGFKGDMTRTAMKPVEALSSVGGSDGKE